MTSLTPLASVLHSKVWPLVAKKCAEQCETMYAENSFMNEAVAAYAPSLLETPIEILALIWGVHPKEAIAWRNEVRIALREHA